MKILKYPIILIIAIFTLNSCGGKFPGADAKKYPPNPKERVKNNLEQGKGFRLDDALKKNYSGTFDFASSNELWRATLDVIDFMPLTSANYSGGIIITDWYSEKQNNDAIKITVRFLSNEVRSDALNIKIFYKECDINLKCTVNEKVGKLNKELQKEILKTAAIYSKQNKNKNYRPYNSSMVKTDD